MKKDILKEENLERLNKGLFADEVYHRTARFFTVYLFLFGLFKYLSRDELLSMSRGFTENGAFQAISYLITVILPIPVIIGLIVFYYMTKTKFSIVHVYSLLVIVILGVASSLLLDVILFFIFMLLNDFSKGIWAVGSVVVVCIYVLSRIGFSNFREVVVYSIRLSIETAFDVLHNKYPYNGLLVEPVAGIDKQLISYSFSDGIKKGGIIYGKYLKISIPAEVEAVKSALRESGIYTLTAKKERLAKPFCALEKDNVLILRLEKVFHEADVALVFKTGESSTNLYIVPTNFSYLFWGKSETDSRYYYLTSEVLALKINISKLMKEKFGSVYLEEGLNIEPRKTLNSLNVTFESAEEE